MAGTFERRRNIAQERKYFIKQDWIFNLESMDDKLHCILYDIEDGTRQFPIEIAGTVCNDEDDLYKLIDECEDLQWIAKSRKVTGREFGRIKQIVQWRVEARYMTCLNNGMSERDAGVCFAEL